MLITRPDRATRLRRLILASAVLMLGGWLPGIAGFAEAQWLSAEPVGGHAVDVFANGLANAGGSWTNVLTFGPDSTVHALAIDPQASSVLYAGTSSGVFKSNDAGSTWRQVNVGLGNRLIFSLAIDPVSSSTLYAGTNSDGVFKTTNGGETWVSITNGLTASYVRAVVVSAGNPAVIFAGTNEGVFKSMNGGNVWTPANDGLSDLRVMSLAADPTSSATVYAGTASGVFKSINTGGGWAAVYGRAFQGISAIGISPSATSIVYLGTLTVPGATTGPPVRGDGILKSGDAGISFAPINNGLPQNTSVNALAVDSLSAQTVYAGANYSGVFKSIDGGSTWTAMNGGLGNPNVLALLIDRQGTIYAGTADGVFKMTESGGTCTANSMTLCLNAGRFEVRVAWRAPTQASPSAGTAAPLTADAGTFWFFSSNNVELVVKVVDGRAFNNKFWIFYGALTNVEYTITVTDTQTGAVKTYFNPQGQLASVADTAAF